LDRQPTGPLLAYATNCYAGESLDELIAALRGEVAAVRALLGDEQPLGLSLRIGSRQAAEISGRPESIAELRAGLEAAGAQVWGANAFPLSAPAEGVYKDGIYRPDWRDRRRLESTLEIARAVAALVPEGARTVLTTMTGTCRLWPGSDSAQAEAECVESLQNCAEGLEAVSDRTGRDLVLGLEPEPFTTAETAAECATYFRERLFAGARAEVARRRLGVNLDLSHCAVMFEEPEEVMDLFRREGVPLFGLHVSAALSVEGPAGHLAGLREFDEPVYLHQVAAVDSSGQITFRSADLGEFLSLPAERLAEFSEARVHFHVPVYAEEIGGLGTTSALTWRGVRAAREHGHTDLFVVETYTWPQLEGRAGAGAGGLAEGIARELRAARRVLEGSSRCDCGNESDKQDQDRPPSLPA
jgi:hypothetical protein